MPKFAKKAIVRRTKGPKKGTTYVRHFYSETEYRKFKEKQAKKGGQS